MPGSGASNRSWPPQPADLTLRARAADARTRPRLPAAAWVTVQPPRPPAQDATPAKGNLGVARTSTFQAHSMPVSIDESPAKRRRVGELPRVLGGGGPVPLAGDVADVRLRQADGVRDGHLRDSRHRDRLATGLVLLARSQKRELLLGQHLESSYTFRIVPWFATGCHGGSPRHRPGQGRRGSDANSAIRVQRIPSSLQKRLGGGNNRCTSRHVTPPPWPHAAMPSTSASGHQPLGAVPRSLFASAWRPP